MKWLLALDVVVVIAFVVIGRDSHGLDEGLTDVIRVAWPFLVGTAVGWFATRAWERPSSLATGGGVLLATVVVGMAVRRFVVGDGIAATFVLVATVFFAIGMLGWRFVAERLTRSVAVD